MNSDAPATPGDAVIYAVCRAAAIDRTAVFLHDGTEVPQSDVGAEVFIWNANAAEQLEAALAEIGWEVVKK